MSSGHHAICNVLLQLEQRDWQQKHAFTELVQMHWDSQEQTARVTQKLLMEEQKSMQLQHQQVGIRLIYLLLTRVHELPLLLSPLLYW